MVFKPLRHPKSVNPRTLLYYGTGGTVGSGKTADRGRDVDPEAQDLLVRVLQKIPHVRLKVIDSSASGDSSTHSFSRRVQTIRRSLEHLDGIDGIVGSYGTDTRTHFKSLVRLMGNELLRVPYNVLTSIDGPEVEGTDAIENTLTMGVFAAYGNASGVFSGVRGGWVLARDDRPGLMDDHARADLQMEAGYFARVNLPVLVDSFPLANDHFQFIFGKEPLLKLTYTPSSQGVTWPEGRTRYERLPVRTETARFSPLESSSDHDAVDFFVSLVHALDTEKGHKKCDELYELVENDDRDVLYSGRNARHIYGSLLPVFRQSGGISVLRCLAALAVERGYDVLKTFKDFPEDGEGFSYAFAQGGGVDIFAPPLIDWRFPMERSSHGGITEGISYPSVDAFEKEMKRQEDDPHHPRQEGDPRPEFVKGRVAASLQYTSNLYSPVDQISASIRFQRIVDDGSLDYPDQNVAGGRGMYPNVDILGYGREHFFQFEEDCRAVTVNAYSERRAADIGIKSLMLIQDHGPLFKDKARRARMYEIMRSDDGKKLAQPLASTILTHADALGSGIRGSSSAIHSLALVEYIKRHKIGGDIFQEAWQQAFRSLLTQKDGFSLDEKLADVVVSFWDAHSHRKNEDLDDTAVKVVDVLENPRDFFTDVSLSPTRAVILKATGASGIRIIDHSESYRRALEYCKVHDIPVVMCSKKPGEVTSLEYGPAQVLLKEDLLFFAGTLNEDMIHGYVCLLNSDENRSFMTALLDCLDVSVDEKRNIKRNMYRQLLSGTHYRKPKPGESQSDRQLIERLYGIETRVDLLGGVHAKKAILGAYLHEVMRRNIEIPQQRVVSYGQQDLFKKPCTLIEVLEAETKAVRVRYDYTSVSGVLRS